MLERLAITGLLVALAACTGERRTKTIVQGGVRLLRVDGENGHAAAREGLAAGDFVLASREIRIAIAGAEPAGRRDVPAGSILDVAAGDGRALGVLDAVVPVIRAGGRDLVLHDVQFETLVDEGRATLRLTASAQTRAGAMLRVQRDYALDAASDALEVRTRVVHAGGPAARDLALGARLAWRSHGPFVPGHGLVGEAASVRAPWLGRSAGATAWGYTVPGEALDLRLRVESRDESAGEAEAWGEARNLVAGEALVTRAVLLARRGDLADVARAVAAVRDEKVVDTALRVRVHGEPEEVFVTVTRPDRRAVLTAVMRPGESRLLPLPEGEYVAYAYAPGYTPSEPARFRAGASAPVDLALPDGGSIRFVARDAEHGRELPVRVVVRGVEGTPDPVLGPRHSAGGAGTIVVAASGRGEVTVPPGRYELLFSHGPEWSIARARVVVTPTLRGEASVRLAHVVPMSDWTACDLHVHARPSGDSVVSIEDRVASLVAEGIEFATPTEHNVVGDYTAGVSALPAAASVAQGGPGLAWVPGVEVTTDRAERPLGHFNVYPFLRDPRAPDGAPLPYLEAPRQIFRAARANNPDAVIQVNHPRMAPDIGYFDRVRLDPARNVAASSLYDPGYDAIEVFSGYSLGASAEREQVLRDWLALLTTGARYVGTASSDSHEVAYHGAGYPRTYVYTPGAGDRAPAPEVVLHALRAGRAFGTSGPMLFASVDGAMPGDTVRISGPAVSLRVKVMAAPWVDVDRVEVYRDGARVVSLSVPPSKEVLRLDRLVEVPVPGARSYVVLVARGDRPMDAVLPYRDARPFAFTNPIWIERADVVHMLTRRRGTTAQAHGRATR